MKKLLIFLFLPILTYGQSRIDYSAVNSVTQVGDTLVVKFQYFKDPNLGDATLTQFDFQYNNKLLSYISHEWQVASNSAQKARNSWNGYKFTLDASKGQTDFDGQYSSFLTGAASYQNNTDWTVERITIQDATGYPNESEFVKYSFKIKDKGATVFGDYSSILNANWANYKEADGTLVDVTGQSDLSLTGIKGGAAGNVTLNVFSNIITNNIGDGTHFGYTVYKKSDVDAGITQNTPVEASGNFDASGQATVAGLVNDTEYFVSVYVDQTQDYLDDAVTVSDLALIFQEAIGAGNTPNGQTVTFDYAIQKLLGNTVGQMGLNGVVDFQDSYEVLGHLQGIATNNNPRISKKGMGYNVSGVKSSFGNKDQNNNPTFNGVITPTDNVKSFDFAHALIGDVNFSHGFEPTSQLATMATANSAKVVMMNRAKYVPETANIDLVSELANNKVIFYINSNVVGMVGSQFNIEYDNTRLRLDDVVFDTGNTMTNFSNVIEAGKVRVGSFDQNLESTVKVGTPYKLVFTPLVQLNNTSGLVTFKVKEGVKADGTQIKFIMN